MREKENGGPMRLDNDLDHHFLFPAFFPKLSCGCIRTLNLQIRGQVLDHCATMGYHFFYVQAYF
jgi:hypothetical protein